jgi:hypothetical protein
LDEVPALAEAMADGDVGAEHADALANATCRLDQQTRAAVLADESSLVARASSSTPEQFARHCRHLVDQVSRGQGVERAERQRSATFVRRSIDPLSGMYRLQAELHPELGARVFNALDTETAALVAAGGDRSVDRCRLAAEALGNLVAGGHQQRHPGITELLVLIDLPTLRHGLHPHTICELADGTPVPVATVRRLACNAHLIPTVLDGDGVPLDMGRRRRLATPEQRHALRTMYRSCAFPRCDATFDRCEIHHLLEWDDLGPTDLANMLPLCSRHHHLVHEGGWELSLAHDRTLTVQQPDGTTYATCSIQMPRAGGRRLAACRPHQPGSARPDTDGELPAEVKPRDPRTFDRLLR